MAGMTITSVAVIVDAPMPSGKSNDVVRIISMTPRSPADIDAGKELTIEVGYTLDSADSAMITVSQYVGDSKQDTRCSYEMIGIGNGKATLMVWPATDAGTGEISELCIELKPWGGTNAVAATRQHVQYKWK